MATQLMDMSVTPCRVLVSRLGVRFTGPNHQNLNFTRMLLLPRLVRPASWLRLFLRRSSIRWISPSAFASTGAMD